MKFIEIKNTTQFVSVDDEDYERIKALETDWVRNGDTIMSTKGLFVSCRHVCLHKFIMNKHCNPDVIVDHKNRDIFNCRKENLRIATRSQNNCNTKKRKDNTSGFRGVGFRRDSWFYTISKDGQRHIKHGFKT